MFKIKQTYETPLTTQDIENWLQEKKDMTVLGYKQSTYKVFFDGISFSIKPNYIPMDRNQSFRIPNYSITKGTYQVNMTGKMQVDLEISPYWNPKAIIYLLLYHLIILAGMSFVLETNLKTGMLILLLMMDIQFFYALLFKRVKDTQPWIEKELQLTKLSA